MESKIFCVRRNVSLDGLWDFAYTQKFDVQGQKEPNLPSDLQFVMKMPVPSLSWEAHIDVFKEAGVWKDVVLNPEYEPFSLPLKEPFPGDSSRPYIVGVGWYRKRFRVDSDLEDADKVARLYVGAVRTEAWCWINGVFAGYHFGHSTPFEISLENFKVGQENELIIAVSNLRRDRLGFNLRGYKGYCGGITRSVRLEFVNRVRIEDFHLYLCKDGLQINWHVELSKEDSGKGLSLDWCISEIDSDEELKQGELEISDNIVDWQTDSKGLQFWSDENPHLYNIKLRVRKGQEIIDEVSRRFGLRFIERCGYSLKLNDVPIFLRGITEHCYYPETLIPPADVEYYRKIIRKLKELGFNWIRCHTWMPPEEFLIAGDELGMFFQVEPPVKSKEQEWIDIFRTARKHPSVIIYCAGNEELLDEAKIEELRRFSILQKEYVPDGLFNPQEGLRGIEYGWGENDLGNDIVEKPFRHNPKRLSMLREFSDVFGQYSWGYLSYISHMGKWDKLSERLEVYKRPCLAHEIGIQGTYLDFDLEKRYENLIIGTDLYAVARNYMEQVGLFDKWRIYFENSCKWQRILRKHCIENARKCKQFAGYDFLGAIDHHNHARGYTGGIMNEFYELKPGNTVEDTLKYNNTNVLLLDVSNYRNLYAGQECNFDLMISLFGEYPISKGIIKWSLTDGEHNYANGQFEVGNVAIGGIKKIGVVKYIAPQIQNPAKLTLYIEFSDEHYNLQNDWDFWVFPRIEDSDISPSKHYELEQQNIFVVSELSENTLESLSQGATVILLGSDFFPTIPLDFQIALPGRCGGNYASVIYEHPITNRFPHEGFCDWQFYSMMKGGATIVFDDLDIPFNPIIEFASSWKLIYKQSVLSEYHVGDGKLLICSLNLSQNEPAVRYFRKLILDYVKCDEFQPADEISVDDLMRIKNTKFEEYGIPHTDMAFDPNAQL